MTGPHIAGLAAAALAGVTLKLYIEFVKRVTQQKRPL
jgi:hypothetical protein